MSEGNRYRQENDNLVERIRKLEQRISVLERNPRLSAGGVTDGGITIDGGNILVQRPNDDINNEGRISIGSNIVVNSEAGMSLTMKRSNSVPGADKYGSGPHAGEIVNGNSILTLATVDGTVVDPTFAFPTIQLNDKSGSVLISDSSNARRGFGDPVLHYAFTDGSYKTSTSTSFAFVLLCEWYMYHAHFRIRVLVQNDSGNSSELRVSENGGNGNLLTQAVALGAFQYIDLIIPRSATLTGNNNNGNTAFMQLEHRRTAGAGTIRTQIISCVGIDLSWFEPY